VDRDDLFLATIDDATNRVANRTTYDLLMAAGLLRKLLVDGQSLVHIANRTRHVRIRYRVNDPKLAETREQLRSIVGEDPVFHAVFDGLNPGIFAAPHAPVELTEGQFLALPVMFYRDVDFSIGDVIRFVANVSGGVHAGAPLGSEQHLMRELETTAEALFASPEKMVAFPVRTDFSIGPPMLRQLISIGAVAIGALQPLCDRIAHERSCVDQS
jgi:hypothetical protein